MNLKPTQWIPGALLLLFPLLASAQSSPVQKDQHVAARLIGEMSHIQPGVPYRVGLLLQHDPGWHTYWKSSTTGYGTSIEWNLPGGFTVSELAWPGPEVYNSSDIIDFVYKDEVLLTAVITPPETIREDQVEIGFTADWLMCEKVCIPGGVSSSLAVPVATDPARPSAEWKSWFERTDAAAPSEDLPFAVNIWTRGERLVLEVSGDSLPEALYFFSDQALVEPAPDAEKIPGDARNHRLEFPLNAGLSSLPEKATGLLYAPGDSRESAGTYWKIAQPIASGPPPESAATAPAARISLFVLLLAFAGGLILNLMPCVFPVLGIKIMGFVNQAGESRGKIVAHGLTFTAGVLISFWTLAGVLLALRSGGSQLGWGFQLQSPGFVAVLAFLLFAFALNMSGLFEVGQSAVGVGSGLTARGGLAGSFFSGVLATVVATPCAAPFLAPALGAALALPPVSSILVFTLIALGLSTPYLLLSIFPGMLRFLPRPGPWMETFKQFMGFLLYATVAYLVWVLAGQLTDAGGYSAFSLLKVLLGLVLLALALWIYGRWGAYHRPSKSKYTAYVVAALLAGASLWTAFSGTRAEASGAQALNWEKWEPGKAESLAREGSIVYVDFTARWCVTCQTNKAAVFSSGKVRDKLRELDVVLLKADWTHQDPEISQALASFGRSAVPFNLIYGEDADPEILPEILTPSIVLEALEKAQGR